MLSHWGMRKGRVLDLGEEFIVIIYIHIFQIS